MLMGEHDLTNPPAIMGQTLKLINHWNISEECS